MSTETGSTQSSRPEYDVVDVTPELARKWLSYNTHNRNMRERMANSYAADMKAGRWAQDGQSIKFGKGDIVLLEDPLIIGGTLLDGQHRLVAVTIADVTVRMLIASNIDDRAQVVMDTGAKRTLSDVLKLRGESHSANLAASLLRVYAWKNGNRKNLRTNIHPTYRQLLDVLEEHPELRRSAEITERVRKAGKIPGGAMSLCHWLFNAIDSDDCAFFFARLADGAGLEVDDPVYALRRALANFSSSHGRTDETLVVAITIKAWNAYREGRKIQVLGYKGGGATPEAYPEPR